MGRTAALFRILAVCLLAAATARGATAQVIPLGQRLAHPNGVSILLKTIEPRADSTVLAATIANPGDRAISLNRSHSFALSDGGHGVHHLNPPLDNPEFQIAPHSQVDAELVFIGPLAPAARQLTLSTNQGIGTANNPYETAPVFQATLRLAGVGSGGAVAEHPDGVSLRVTKLTAGSSTCDAMLNATNGNDRTIVLNQGESMALSDERGGIAPLTAPEDNAELVVPAGNRLDADLVFDCRRVDPAASELTLATNRGTQGTTDNPYETLPVFALRVPVQHGGGAADGTQSHAAVVPIARSVLTATTGAPAVDVAMAVSRTPPTEPIAATGSGMPPTPVLAAATTDAPLAPPPAAGSPPPAPPPPKETPRTVPELEAALHASHGFRGLDVTLPADTLFGATGSALAAGADASLADLARLIAETHPVEVTVAGNTDSVGSDTDNMELSKARAQAVAAWLQAHATKRVPKIVAQGYGRTRPVAPNHKADGSDNPEGRAQNRRIDVNLRR